MLKRVFFEVKPTTMAKEKAMIIYNIYGIPEEGFADLIPANGVGPHVTAGLSVLSKDKAFMLRYCRADGYWDVFVRSWDESILRVVLAVLNKVPPEKIQLRQMVQAAA